MLSLTQKHAKALRAKAPASFSHQVLFLQTPVGTTGKLCVCDYTGDGDSFRVEMMYLDPMATCFPFCVPFCGDEKQLI